MPRTGHFLIDDLAKTNSPAYHFICGKVKDNASLDEIVRGLKESYGLTVSKNAIHNWRSKKYSRELQAQEVAVEIKSLLEKALKDKDPKEATTDLIRSLLSNLALQVLQKGQAKPEEILNYTAVFARLDNERLKIKADEKKHEVELAKVHLAKKTAEKQIEYYRLKIAEIQKTAKDEGQVSESQLKGILQGYFGIDGQDKKKDKAT